MASFTEDGTKNIDSLIAETQSMQVGSQQIDKDIIFEISSGGYVDRLKALLDSGIITNIDMQDWEKDYLVGKSALMHACVEGHESCVKVLLDAGADIDMQDSEAEDCTIGKTALMHTVIGGHESCVQVLLDAGADTEVRDDGYWQKENMTALMMASQLSGGYSKTPIRCWCR